MLFTFGSWIPFAVRLRVLGPCFFITLLCLNTVASQYEFDACDLPNRGTGICRVFEECQELVDAVKRKEITLNDPARCGFKGRQELICCPGSGGNVNSRDGKPTFEKNQEVTAVTTEKPIDHSVRSLSTTMEPDFWLPLLSSTTTTTTTAQPDFWLDLLTTTTPKPLVIDGQALDTDAELYDFSKLLSQNKKSEKLQNGVGNIGDIRRDNLVGTNVSESGSHGESLSGAESGHIIGNQGSISLPGAGFGNGMVNMHQSGFNNGPVNVLEPVNVPGSVIGSHLLNRPVTSFDNGHMNMPVQGFINAPGGGIGNEGFNRPGASSENDPLNMPGQVVINRPINVPQEGFGNAAVNSPGGQFNNVQNYSPHPDLVNRPISMQNHNFNNVPINVQAPGFVNGPVRTPVSGLNNQHQNGQGFGFGHRKVPRQRSAHGHGFGFGNSNGHGHGFRNGHGQGFANGLGQGLRNGHGQGLHNGHGQGFGNGHGHGFRNAHGQDFGNGRGNGFVEQPVQFQERPNTADVSLSLFGLGHMQAQLPKIPFVNVGMRSNILARPSIPEVFTGQPGRGRDQGHVFGNQFRNKHVNKLGPIQNPPSFNFQDPPIEDEMPARNPFLPSALPTVTQNEIDVSPRQNNGQPHGQIWPINEEKPNRNPFLPSSLPTIAQNEIDDSPRHNIGLPHGPIGQDQNRHDNENQFENDYGNYNQNTNRVDNSFENQPKEISEAEKQQNLLNNIREIFDMNYQSPVMNAQELPASAIRMNDSENEDQRINGSTQRERRIPKPVPQIVTTSSTTSKRPSTITRTERPSVAACRAIEEGLNPILTPHILDGTPVNPGEYPHMAAIGYSGIGNEGGPYDFRCGGTLIHERFVLTAAHCVNSRNITPSIVRLGMANFDDPEELPHRVDMTVRNVFIHPNYSNSRKYDDIALLELQSAITPSEWVYPTCLFTDMNDPPADSKLYVSGWGTVNTRTRMNSRILLKARLQIEPLDRCNASYVEYGLTRQLDRALERTQICAHDPGFTKDACQGDSGGPLLMVEDESTKNFRIIGVISTGFGCATAIPGLYTRVAAYLDFIENIVWPTL